MEESAVDFSDVIAQWMSPTDNVVNFRTTVAHTFQDKLNVLEERDKYLREAFKNKSSVVSRRTRLRGTCPDMCPEKERLLRELRCAFSIYESMVVGDERHVVPELLVKEYARSSADQDEPLPHELRPEPVLTMTMSHLINEVMTKVENDREDLGEWYHFLWDRLRSIRKDIIQQQLCNVKVVAIVEQCARFHIWCYDKFCGVDTHLFDDKINTENLVNCLQMLAHMYTDLARCNIVCENEAEFRAYMALLQLNESDILWMYHRFSENVRCSEQIREVARIYNAFSHNLYSQFFNLVDKTTYLNACILQRYFVAFRIKALKIIIGSHCPGTKTIRVPLSHIQSQLRFDSWRDASFFVQQCGFILDERGEVTLSKGMFTTTDLRLNTSSKIIRKKRVPLIDVMRCGPVEAPTMCSEYKVHCSFTNLDVLKKEARDASDQRKKLLDAFPDYNPDEDNVTHTGGSISQLQLNEMDQDGAGEEDLAEEEEDGERDVKQEDEEEDEDEERESDITIDDCVEGELHRKEKEDEDDSRVIQMEDEVDGSGSNNYGFSTHTRNAFPQSNIFPSQQVVSPKSPRVSGTTANKAFKFGSEDAGGAAVHHRGGQIHVENPTTSIFTGNASFIHRLSYEEEFSSDVRKIDKTPAPNVTKASTIFGVPPSEDKCRATLEEIMDKNEKYMRSVIESLNNEQGKFLQNMREFQMDYFNKNAKQTATTETRKELKKLRKIVKRKLKRDSALKYGKVWKAKVKISREKRAYFTAMTHLTPEEHVNLWGKPEHTIPQSMTARANSLKTASTRIRTMLSGDSISPNYLGKSLADNLITRTLHGEYGFKADTVPWKCLISLPDNREDHFQSFVGKLKETCVLSFYKNQHVNLLGGVQVVNSTSGIKVLTSVNVQTGIPDTEKSVYGVKGICFFLSDGWESAEDAFIRMNSLIRSGLSDPVAVSVVLIRGIEYEEALTTYLRYMKRNKFVTDWHLRRWENLLTTTRAAVLWLSENTAPIPAIKSEKIPVLLDAVVTDFFHTLSANRYLLHLEESPNYSPNIFISLYNQLLLRLKNIVLGFGQDPKYFLATEFLPFMASNPECLCQGVSDSKCLCPTDTECVYQSIVEFQLPRFKKWPPHSVGKLVKMIRNYCNTVGDHQNLLYPHIIRNLNLDQRYNASVEDVIKEAPWNEIVQLWAKSVVRKIESDESKKKVSDMFVCCKHEDLNELTNGFWWIENDILETPDIVS